MFESLKNTLDKIKGRKKISANVDIEVIRESCLRILNKPFDFDKIEEVNLYLCLGSECGLNDVCQTLSASTYFNTIPSEYISKVIESFYLYPINLNHYASFIHTLLNKINNKIDAEKIVEIDRKYNLRLSLSDIILEYYNLTSIYELYPDLTHSADIYSLTDGFSQYFSLSQAKEFFLHYYNMGFDLGLLFWLFSDYYVESKEIIDMIFSILEKIKSEDYPRLILWMFGKQFSKTYISEKALESNNLSFQFGLVTTPDTRYTGNSLHEVIQNLVNQGYHLRELVQNAKVAISYILKLIYEKDEAILDSILSEISEDLNADIDQILLCFKLRYLREYKVKRETAVRFLKRGTSSYDYLIKLYDYTSDELREIYESLYNKGLSIKPRQ